MVRRTMADSIQATIETVTEETPSLLRIRVKCDDDVRAKYATPGQVVVVRPTPEDQVYLAIASSPGDDHLEVLLGPGAAGKIGPEPGKTITMDPPMGRGFDVAMAKGNDVLLFAVGSAIAPIRPLVQFLRKDRSAYGRITLYVGAHTDQDFAFRGEFEDWRRDRIDVVQSVSKPWVQDKFRADPPPVDNAVAYICGMKAMMEGVTEALVAAGMPAERIGKNW